MNKYKSIDHLGMTLQLFIQPSLSAIYVKNNKKMTSADFELNFPAIPLLFGLSSDLASGWSKLVYEQTIINKNQQKMEVEILGLGPDEAFVVEECVKLLFGYKILISLNDIWLFLKVCDMLGITQTPLMPNDIDTIQEQILTYSKDNIGAINLCEAWDYVMGVIESGGEGITIHRPEIRTLCLQISEDIKQILISSNFEILANYAHDSREEMQQFQQSSPNKLQFSRKSQSNPRFTMKEIKREYYIQLRSLFYNQINTSQIANLTPDQGVVRVLFDELDKYFELDGYINKYIEGLGTRIDQLNQKLNVSNRKFKNQIGIIVEVQ